MCCLGSLHADQPEWDMAVDVSGPPSFSPLMSLPILEANPPHWTGTPTPNITPHTEARDRFLPGWHQVGGLTWGSQDCL